MKVLALTILISATNVFAWGPTGHRVVGDIAERYTDPTVLARAQGILGGLSLARVANWADEIRSDQPNWGHTFNWHHTEWPDLNHDHSELSTHGKLMTALKENLAILSSKESSNDKKAEALKFVIHLVGDLHQPLHVGNGVDQGGNLCRVSFHGKVVNFHSLWDDELINFTKLSYTEMAKFITLGHTASELADWKKGSLLDWARESRMLGEMIYPAGERTFCQNNLVEVPKLAYEYSYKFVPVIERRLYQAGLRLAVILNQYLR